METNSPKELFTVVYGANGSNPNWEAVVKEDITWTYRNNTLKDLASDLMMTYEDHLNGTIKGNKQAFKKALTKHIKKKGKCMGIIE